ncbi:MAG: molybdate ABC transporter substrate-binding protein [Aeromonas sp.]
MRFFFRLVLLCLALPVQAAPLRIAAASDLKFALDALVAEFKTQQPTAEIAVSYGSSGKFHSQIRQGAPFDLFFSADIRYAQALAAVGLTASAVQPYAVGRLALWRKGDAKVDALPLTLTRLTAPEFKRIALANPRHAPYGQKALEALRFAGIEAQVQSKLVLGESVSHAAHFVQTGHADVGIIALALAHSPALRAAGHYALIPSDWHTPLVQGMVITLHGEKQPLARAFSDWVLSAPGQARLREFGFAPAPREAQNHARPAANASAAKRAL